MPEHVMPQCPTRREFLWTTAGAIAAAPRLLAADKQPRLAREVGITTSSLSGHLVKKPSRGKFTLLELPRVMRDELGMRVIDLNTSSLASFEPKYLAKIRKAAEDAGCLMTNLKLNQRGLDMSSPKRLVREKALREYERSIDAAAALGVRWARPLPLKKRPKMKLHVQAWQRLAEYAAKRKVRMLVENYGWMESDPESVVTLIKAIGRDVAASPDTGNWKDNEIRYKGLKATFPLAVTCDFKARKLGRKGEHALYDLKACFQIGWRSGFRGPWCLEHANADRRRLFRELILLRDRLKFWMKEAGKT